MKKVVEDLDNYKSIAKGIAKQFGNKCEVVIHDYSNPFESSIVHIENGSVTGRTVGQSGTNIGLRVFNGNAEEEGMYNYLTRTPNGKYLRSSTVYIKNEENKTIGTLCINFDISELVIASKVIDEFINVENDENVEETVIYNEVDDLLEQLINESIKFVGAPVSHMTREQKIEGIKFLEKKGAFLIKKAGEKVSNYYDISKYTIYNYLNEKTE